MSSTKLRKQLINVHTYAVTPFKADNLYEVDHDAFAHNLEFLVARGVKVIAVSGGTGEFEALTNVELEALTRTAQRTVGARALVIATLPPNLKAALELAPRYAALDVQVLLGMPPLIRGRVPRDLEGVYDYYHQLAQATDLPLMPYNTQGWPAEFYVRLSEIDRIIGIKDPCHEPHTLFRAVQLLGDRFVWIGNKRHDPGVVHLRYQMGMQAFTSGQSNFWPEPELAIHTAAQQQDWPRVIELQQQCQLLEQLRLESDDAAMVKGRWT
ncbi:dihydrodipicolinate synthase family protein [Chloroflexi bacterium TSY]|nr:dihydrodipicolinate synthase family protein [Chloroflexi bacterium TSY]